MELMERIVDVRPVWVEVDLAAIAHNLREIRRITAPQAEILAVVKANAYGHGMVEVSKVALANGADRLGVATTAEAIALRQAGFDVPILILGLIAIEQVPEVVAYDLTQTVSTLEVAESLSRVAARWGKKVKVHVKIDTGMGRIGLLPAEAKKFIENIIRLPHLEVEGIFTHFAVADEADKTYTYRQLALFNQLISELEAKGIHIPIKHAANSAAILDLPETHFDLVRPGILIYGLYPSPHVSRKVDLRPALSLKSQITYIKQVPAGSGISYGLIYTTPRNTTIATLPLGYADGWSRLLSTEGEALVHGRRVPIVGRICMDQCMIDVGSVPDVRLFDEVVLIGKQGDEEITVEEVAAKMGTINYEVICAISNRVPRIYING